MTGLEEFMIGDEGAVHFQSKTKGVCVCSTVWLLLMLDLEEKSDVHMAK